MPPPHAPPLTLTPPPSPPPLTLTPPPSPPPPQTPPPRTDPRPAPAPTPTPDPERGPPWSDIVTAYDLAQASFEVGDRVEFRVPGGSTLHGTIEKLNPKRAVVRCDADTWRVPYPLLDHPDGTRRRGNERRLVEVAEEARKLMDTHGLADWTFRFSAARHRLGECRERERVLLLSRKHAVNGSHAEVTDTILHEIAHALAGAKARHGPAWKEVARRIGATPKARAEESADARRRKEAAKARFRSGMEVRFRTRGGQRQEGTIVRMNRVRATVRCTDQEVFLVPYSLLEPS